MVMMSLVTQSMARILLALNGETSFIIDAKKYDYLIAVDGGYRHFFNQGLIPNLLIGDLDSVINKVDSSVKQIKLNPIKDDTDFKASLIYAEENFIDAKIDVIGFASQNRLEHFYANLKFLKPNITFLDSDTKIFCLEPKAHELVTIHKYISLFSTSKVEGLTIKNAHYPLENYTLETNDPLCISNEAIENQINISFKTGMLIIFMSN